MLPVVLSRDVRAASQESQREQSRQTSGRVDRRAYEFGGSVSHVSGNANNNTNFQTNGVEMSLKR